MSKAHVLYYKTEEGEWAALPYNIVNMYECYLRYCQENNITAVDQDTYYATLGNLAEYTSEIQRLVGNLDNLEELTDKLGEGVLPTSLGGTGQNYTSYADLVSAIRNELRIDSLYATLDQKIDTLWEHTFNNSLIQMGTESPDTNPNINNTTVYYFQYVE